VKHAALRKLIRLRVYAIVRIPVRVQVKAAPGEFRQRRLQLQRVTEAAGPLLKIGIAKNQVIQRKAAVRLLTQQAVRDKGTRQNIALYADG